MTEKKQEFITKKDYELLSEATYLDKSGIAKKTKKVVLHSFNIEDGSELSQAMQEKINIAKALEMIVEKGYIKPSEDSDGTILVPSLHFRTARLLFDEYCESFF